MPSAFNFSASPFDCLTQDEQRLVRSHLDIAYFPQGDTVLAPGSQPTHLFVIIKGHVQQWDGGNEVVTTFGPDDTPSTGRGLVAAGHQPVCGRRRSGGLPLAKQAVTELIASNATFGALLFSDLSNKRARIEQQSRHELQSLSMARVDEAVVRPPLWSTPAPHRRGGTAVSGAAHPQRAGARYRSHTAPPGNLHHHRAAARHLSGPLDQLAVGTFGQLPAHHRPVRPDG